MDSAHLQETINHARTAIRGAFILNGASAISLLTFIGNNISNPNIANANCHNLSSVLVIFAIGTIASVLAHGFSYLSDSAYIFNTNDEKGDYWKKITIITFFTSLSLFLIGVIYSALIFRCLGI